MRWTPTSLKQLVAAEMGLLQHTVTRSSFRSSRVALASGESINTLEVFTARSAPPTVPTSRPLVFAHGFGAGSALFAPNMDTLAQLQPDRRVIAFDWLGMGGSSRPEFVKRRGCAPEEVIDTSEAFFCDSMAEWADRMGLHEFDLIGHSLGGYLSAAFALRYPERVSRLVLVSPVGLPDAGVAAISTGDTDDATSPAVDDSDAAKADSIGIPSDVWRQLPWQVRMIVRAWNYNVTPQGIVRMLGKYGPRLMSAAVGRRLGNAIPDTDTARLVADYLYHINASTGSGEFAMNALLAPRVVNGRPGVYARRPVGHRLSTLPMPVAVLFGDDDWMAHPDNASILEDVHGPGLVTIPTAGHHLYMDNPAAFLSAVRNATA